MSILKRYSDDQPRDPNGKFGSGDPHDSEATKTAGGKSAEKQAEDTHGIKIGDKVTNLSGDSGKVISVSGNTLKVLPEGGKDTQLWHASHTTVQRSNMSTIERRYVKELRAEGDGDNLSIVGYAATFDSLSKDLGGFVETIAPGAFTRALAEKQDVKCLFNHDANIILGRTTSGTLTLMQDEKGLRYRCQLDPKQQSHRDLHASIMRKDIDECSFAFSLPDANADKWENRQDAKGDWFVQRTLKDVNLFDVSPVTFPAYNDTVVGAREGTMTPEIRSTIAKLVAQRAAVVPEKRDADESLEDAIGKVAKALADKFPATEENMAACYGGKYWLCETYLDYVIAQECGGGDLFKIPYVADGDSFVFGTPLPVEVEYVPSDRAKARVEEFRALKAGHLQALANLHQDTADAHKNVAADHTDAADAHQKAADALQAAADSKRKCDESMGDCDDERCECQNRSCNKEDVYDDEDMEDSDDDDDSRAAKTAKRATRAASREVRADGKVLTKLVDGKELTKDQFAFVGDPEKTTTWKLPIHDAGHAQDALARFGQTDGIPEDQKASVLRKIKKAAQKFDINVSDAARALFNALPMDDNEIADMKLRFELAVRK